jgi:hypothetical protein
MTVADLSDHDTIDDPVEVFNVENAAVKKKKRLAFLDGVGSGILL